ncbi:hypothetical protein [Nocardia sp. NPDC052566]|uniref:hypothetical protein n=1 Tax=Nocardia sp. NPDC052566 TaxID=3364330 RepID=UPI0037CCB461
MQDQFFLPLPELLPHDRAEFAAAATEMTARGRGIADLNVASQGFSVFVEDMRALCLAGVTMIVDRPAGPGWGSDENEQDRLFGVARVRGDSATILVGALMLSSAEVLADAWTAGSDVDDAAWRDLLRGVAATLEFLVADAGGTSAPAVPDRRGTGARRAEFDPRQRWRLGHRLFYALIQSLTVTLSCFAAATARANTAAAEEALRVATALMRASAASLLFTSDFPASLYTHDVREHVMRPPNTIPGVSGIQGRDHQVLVGLLRDLRPVFGTMNRTQLPYREFRAATQHLFATHEHICAKFVGPSKPSLLMEARGSSTEESSGVVALRNLTRRRLRLLDGHRDY